MRNDPPVFTIENKSPVKEPHYVVEIAFDASASSVWYFTSHENTGDAEKNLLTYSEQFETSSWVKTYTTVSADTTATYAGDNYVGDRVTINRLVRNEIGHTESIVSAFTLISNISIVADQVSGPYGGGVTADLITENASSGYHRVGRLCPLGTGTGWRHFTVHAKKKERKYFAIQTYASSDNTSYYRFNTSSFTVSTTPSIYGNAPTSATIEELDNGWCRCDVTRVIDINDGDFESFVYLEQASGGGVFNNYVGDGSSGMYWTGLQLTDKQANDSYVSTSLASITASAAHVGAWFVEQTTSSRVEALAGNTFTGHAKCFASSLTPTVFKVILSDQYETETTSQIFNVVGMQQYGSALSMTFVSASTTKIKQRVVFASTSATNYLKHTKIDTTFVNWITYKTGYSTTVDSVLAPDGTSTGMLIKKDVGDQGWIFGVASAPANVQCTADMWIKHVSGAVASTDVIYWMDRTTANVSAEIGHAISSSWSRIPFTYTRDSNQGSQDFYIGTYSVSASYKIAVWVGQVVVGAEIKSYVSASSVTPVTGNAPKLHLDNAQLNAGGALNPYYEVSSKVELVPTETYEGTVQGLTGTTQRLDTLKSTSTIGAIRISLVDEEGDISSLIYGKLALGYGLRGKRLRVYAGYDGYAFSDYQLIQTQIIDSIDYREGVYTINCADVQRIQRQDIFTLAKTTLADACSVDASSVKVYDLTGFEMLAHGNSFTDAQSSTVGYFKIEDEIIAYSSTTTGGGDSYFKRCRRGALNTKAAAHEYDVTVGSDKQVEAEEIVYLEMPAPKLAYALLTGNLIGQPGETLPDSWHMNVASSYVAQADFTGIGADIWDADSGDTNGLILRFAGVDEIDGKRFIEEQIYRVMGCYSPIYADGTIGLRRMTGIMSDAPYVAYLDHSNLTNIAGMRHDMRAVRNKYSIDWNYNFQTEEFTRRNLIIDTQSIGRHGDVPTYTLEFEGLHGSRHTFNTTAWLFDALRDRYASPPISMTVEALPSQNDIEVGDIVRVQSSAVQDYTTGQTLDRSFEVQNVANDWITGRVRLQLMGASEKASPFQATQQQTYALTTAFYSGFGTDICSAYGSSYFSTVGGVVHLTSSLTVAGASTMASSIFYCMNDLTINTGVTLGITDNLQLRVMGHFTVNGGIDGIGAGASANAERGVFGFTKAYGGVDITGIWLAVNCNYACTDGTRYDGLASIPVYNLDYNGAFTIAGLPADLRGKSGPSGGRVATTQNMQLNVDSSALWLPAGPRKWGGGGGRSGAGLMLINRGMSFGVNGNINLSGDDAFSGAKYTFPCTTDPWDPPCVDYPELWSGGGGGGAGGAVFVVLDGKDATMPSFTTNTLTSKRGGSSYQATRQFATPAGWISDGKLHVDQGGDGVVGAYFDADWGSYYTGYSSTDSSQSMSRIVYLEPEATAEEDPNDLILNAPFDVIVSSGTEHLYVNQDGTVVTRMYVSWDVSSVVAIAGYEVQYQLALTAVDWYNVPPVIGATASAAYIELVQDSVAYDVRVRSASNDRRTSEWGYAAEHTVEGKTANPANVSVFEVSIDEQLAVLEWTGVADADLSHYEIRYGVTGWDLATLIVKIKATKYSLVIDWQGDRTFLIKAVDTSNNDSAVAASVLLQISAPTIDVIDYTIVGGQSILLTWAGVSGSLSIARYAITTGETYDIDNLLDYAYDERLNIADSTHLTLGYHYFWVTPIDVAGNFGTPKDISVFINRPITDSIDYTIVSWQSILLTWSSSPGSLSIARYAITTGETYEAYNLLGYAYDERLDIVESPYFTAGTQYFWITPIDVVGNFGVSKRVSILITAPSAPTITFQVIDNFVLLRWAAVEQTFEIEAYEILKGDTIETAESVGTLSAKFTTLFESQSGVYRYWIRAKDKAGNWGAVSYADVFVNQPPDYVLNHLFVSEWSGTFENCMVDTNGTTLVYPVNTSTTIASAVSTAWASPSAAIASGYEYWVQPSKTTMMYSEIFDLGSDLASSQLTVDYTETVLDGVVSTWTNILTRATTTVAWVTVVTSSLRAFATDLRYVKIDFHASTNGDGKDLATLSNFQLRLDSKIKADSGSGYVSTVVSAATVTFGETFADVVMITVTPNSTSPIFAVYDFTDVPNPTEFDVYLFDNDGAAVSGAFSWTARGF